MSNKFDCVVIGAGSGGLTSAVGLAKTGSKVLLIEKDHLGGECTNSGCIPSKALLHYTESYWAAARQSGKTEKNETYRQAAFTYVRNKINEVLADETAEHFIKQGITVKRGEAIFLDKETITVGDERFSFKKAIIATGSKPRQINLPNVSPDKILTNQNLFELKEIPKQLVIVGGGPIGLEMGQALAKLGSEVSIIDSGEFGKLEDEAIRPILKQSLTKLGIKLYPQAKITDHTAESITIESPIGLKTLSFDYLLVAIGRLPNLPAGLTEAGIASDETGIEVNQNWQTTNRRVYALGDVAARLKFTHVADDTARQVVTHIVSRGLLKPTTKAVPKVTYTDPEIAQVGLSFAEAADKFGENNIFRIEVPFSENDRARTDEATDGILVMIVRRLTGRILGAHLIGPRAGEIIATLTLAIETKTSLYKLRSVIFPYPTYSLILKKAGDYFLATQIKHLKPDVIGVIKSAAPKILALALWVSLIYYFYDYQKTYSLTVTELSVRLFEFITGSIYGPILYILAYAVRPLTFFPGTILTILSGVFFGWLGIVYTIIGANLSASLAYLVGYYFSTKNETAKTTLLGRFKETLRQNPFLSILTMRLTFFPFDAVNYGAGLLRVPFWPYLAATIVGTILGITTFVSLGAALSVEEIKQNGFSLDVIDSRFLVISAVIFILSLVVTRYLPKHKS